MNARKLTGSRARRSALVASGTIAMTVLATGPALAGVARAAPPDPPVNVIISDFAANRMVEVAAHTGAETTFGAGLANPIGVTTDAAGNVYVVDAGNNQVVKVPADGSPQTAMASGALDSPFGLAIDGGGNLFVADTYDSRVAKITPAGNVSSFGTGISDPFNVATDPAGDVFVANTGKNDVIEIPANGGPQITIPTTGLEGASGVAVDTKGDVFISDIGDNRVVEEPAGGGAQITVASGLNFPFGLATDAAGNLFIADAHNNRVVEVPAGGGALVSVASGLHDPQGVAVTPAGDAVLGTPISGGGPNPPAETPEAPLAILLPAGAAAVLGGAFLVLRRRPTSPKTLIRRRESEAN